MLKQVALVTILMISSKAIAVSQPLNSLPNNVSAERKVDGLLAGTEAQKAIQRLGDLSPVAIRERLTQLREPAYLPGSAMVKRIVELQHLPIAEGKRVDQLKEALKPVLKYHGRDLMPIYVLRSDQPKAYMAEHAVIFITTRMMVIASHEEIRGIVAHELAHEYLWDERLKAMKEKDGRAMRECELFCDAVAAFTLKELGDDPSSYGRILERLTVIGITAGNATRHESDTHPSLDARKKLNKFLCELLDYEK